MLRITQGGNLGDNGPQSFSQITNGLYEEEEDGLDFEERKRKRNGPSSKTPMDTDDTLIGEEQGNKSVQIEENVFSNAEYTSSNRNVLATLAVQASRPL